MGFKSSSNLARGPQLDALLEVSIALMHQNLKLVQNSVAFAIALAAKRRSWSVSGK